MKLKGTTILCVRRNNQVVIAGDGQVSLGEQILKSSARKVRRLYEGRVIAGFAGSTADAITLFEKFEGKLKDFKGNLLRSAVELAKDWRTDKVLRRLDALLIVADESKTLLVSGSGDIIEPDDDVIAIGSGGSVALAASRALCAHTKLSAHDIANEAMKIAADIDVYTNSTIVLEEIP